MLEPRLHRNLDWPLFLLTYLTAICGVVIIFSATRGDPTAFYKKQIIWIVLGTVGMFGVALFDYHYVVRFTRHLYVFNLALLSFILLGVFSRGAKGAQRWINLGGFAFQPSELAKLIVILTLAVFLARAQDSIKQPKTLLLSLFYVAVPAALIFKQPDLGTSLVVIAIWFGMVFMAGARARHLVGLIVGGGLLFVALWHSGVLKEYQKNRVLSYVNPTAYAQEAGYHVHQARIAIGSGGMWGKGLLNSTQVRGGYIPEKQTDFIFTAIGEEFGFVGCVFIIALYAALLLRGALIIAASSEDALGKLIATGVVTLLAFHVLINIGMNLGLLPVVGVPLLLISYGGSHIILTFLCIGLLQSVSRHRHQLLF